MMLGWLDLRYTWWTLHCSERIHCNATCTNDDNSAWEVFINRSFIQSFRLIKTLQLSLTTEQYNRTLLSAPVGNYLCKNKALLKGQSTYLSAACTDEYIVHVIYLFVAALARVSVLSVVQCNTTLLSTVVEIPVIKLLKGPSTDFPPNVLVYLSQSITQSVKSAQPF